MTTRSNATTKPISQDEIDALLSDMRMMRASGHVKVPVSLDLASRMIAAVTGALPQANGGRSA